MTSPPVAPSPAPLRCHLLIGPPASGKTTLAGVLAALTGAVVLQALEQRLIRLEQLVPLIAQQVGVPQEAIARLLPPAAPPS